MIASQQADNPQPPNTTRHPAARPDGTATAPGDALVIRIGHAAWGPTGSHPTPAAT